MSYTAPTALPSVEDVGEWSFQDAWTKSEITTPASFSWIYGTYYEKGNTAYSETNLYALYYNTSLELYTTSPTACIDDPGVLVYDENINDEREVNYGEITSFNLTFAQDGTGTSVTWESDNTDVATVSGDEDDATVTIVGAGIATITATVAANGSYCSGSYDYTLQVNAVAPTLSDNTSGKELKVSSITSTGATFSGGVVTAKGDAAITRYGFIIGTSSTVVVGGTDANAPVAGSYWSNDIALNTAFGSKTATTRFSPNTTYYVRAFAYNGSYYGYSSAKSFTTLQRYAVTYYKNDGGATSEVEYKDHGVNYTVSSDKFSRDHYTLTKWHTLAAGTGGTDYAKGATYSTNAALDLYAIWTPDNYTISFDGNGGTGEMGDVEKAYNTSYALPACGFTAPSGKVFDGWAEGSAVGTKRTLPYEHTVTGDITFYAVWRDATYTNYTFACAELELDEPENGSDNVLENVVYLTSTSGQKVRSAAHFRVHGDGLTPSQTVKFTTGDDALDELYSFRKADGTEVATNASGVVDEEVYIYYQPTATTDGRDEVTSVKAYVERKGDGSGKPKAVVNEERTINGRHLPSQFIIAAKSGGVWYALPSDASVTGAQMGYTFTPDDATTPTKADVAPQTALYSIYAPRTDGTNKSYVRFASTNDDKTLWSNSSTTYGIKDNALVTGTSSKGDQYEWRLENTGADSYKLWNNASYSGAGRYLGIKGTKWNVFNAAGDVVQDLKILSVDDVSEYIGLSATDWEETAFNFTVTSGSVPDPYDHAQIAYNGNQYDASISGTKLTINDADFTEAGGFTAAPGSQLIVEWCNNTNAVLAQGSVISPIIINSNTVDLSEYDAEALAGTDIFVTNGAKLTVSDDITVHDVTVNAGSTLVVDDNGGDGKTLEIKNGKLTLRGGWTTIGGVATYDMPRVYINPLSTLKKSSTTVNLYMDIYKAEEGKHYYPLAVPFPVAVNDIDYVDPAVAAASVYGKHYVIKRYNGASRAENGAVDANWEVVPAGSTLQPGEGYIITALAVGGKAQLVVPMKNVANAWTTLGEQGSVTSGLTTTTKNVLEVTHHIGAATAADGAAKRNEGWNMLGVPFMSCYTAGTDMYDGEGSADLMTGRMTLSGDPADPYGWESSDVVYVSVPTHDFSEYIQTDITSAKLVPGWSFFIQVGTTGNLTFLKTEQAANSNMPIYAPKREKAAMPVVKTGIVLSDGEKSDKTTFLISDKYSSDYEIGADLEKMFGNGFTLSTYSVTNGTNLAFNALSTYEAEQAIPVGVRIPAEGEYTFSLNSRYAGANITRLDLIDYEAGEVTNLLQANYTFTAPRGQNDSRFAINVTKAPQISTDVESTEHGIQGTDIRKVIIDDKLFIIRDGLMYDATGKRVMKGAR